jgi:small conductance mechanosensitive channel
MEEIITIYQEQILWCIKVIAIVVLLRVITHYFYKWLLKREQLRFPDENFSSLRLARRILQALWLVLGVIALSFVFVDNDNNDAVIKNFKIVLYLGLLSVATIVIAATINMWFKKSIKRKIEEFEDPTSYKFLRYVAVAAIYTVGILFGLLAFPSLRGVAQTALGGAGVIAIVIGIASQEALSNVIGGVFIISFKPFRVGHIIKISDDMVGTVVDITLRHTVIRNFENKMIVIPNSIINKEKLINFQLGDPRCCERVEVGISYDSDIDLAKRIMQEECENHPLIIDNRSIASIEQNHPIVKTAVLGLNDFSITIRAWAWTKNFDDSFELRIDVLESIKKRFDKEGVNIPFPTRTVYMNEKK